jgi:hypothetical protein
MDRLQSRQEYVEYIQNYTSSDEFRSNLRKFATEGWLKLFLKHKRQLLLNDTGRDAEILFDRDGNPYYQGYKYSPPNREEIHCHDHPDNCRLGENAVLNADWLGTPKGQEIDEEWINQWKSLSPGR